MGFPIYRPRRTRATENLRSMIRETELSVNDLIYPLFVVPGKNVKHEIESLPGNYHWSLDRLPEVLDEISLVARPPAGSAGRNYRTENPGSYPVRHSFLQKRHRQQRLGHGRTCTAGLPPD